MAARRRPHAARVRELREPLREPRDIADRRRACDARPSVLRADRRKRPRVRDLSSTRRRNERIAREHSSALASHQRQGSAVRRDRRPNCPHLPEGDEAAHSLLLNRGLFRVFLPWPPRTSDGEAIEPEFTIEVVRDPTRCNTHPVHGLQSAAPTISVYRRPRPVANLKYVTAAEFGVGPSVSRTRSRRCAIRRRANS